MSNAVVARRDARKLANNKVATAAGYQVKKKILGGLKVKCLLRPEINPGNVVEIESAQIQKALFRAVEVEHNGDTHGQEWTTTLTTLAV